MSAGRTTSLAAALLVLTVGLTACGSGGDSTDSSVAVDTPSAGPSVGPGGGLDLDAIRSCLTAAGLEDAIPSDLPTGQPTGQPSDLPTDLPTDLPSDFPTDGTPSGFASGMPSGVPSGVPSGGPGGGGGLFQAFQDPDVQAALQACGIDLPTGGPSRSG